MKRFLIAFKLIQFDNNYFKNHSQQLDGVIAYLLKKGEEEF